MYAREVDGQVFEFATPWFMHRANKMMYDRQTKTMWQQFLGEPIVGPLVDSGLVLEALPVVVTSWGEWLAAHPDTTVLSDDTGVYPKWAYRPEENSGSVYYGYRLSPQAMFPAWRRSELLPEKVEVLGLRINGQPKAYLLTALHEAVLLNDMLGGENVVVVSSGPVGGRVYERGDHTFSLPPEPDAAAPALVDEQGRSWRMEEDALVLESAPDEWLARIHSNIAYWFGWYLFHPTTAVYGETS